MPQPQRSIQTDPPGTFRKVRMFFRSPAGNLASYFILLAGALTAAYFMVPWFRDLLEPTTVDPSALDGFSDAARRGAPGMTPRPTISQTLRIAAAALIGALIFAAPIVRMYTVIMRQEGYDRSFVRMLASLPVVVAGVVQVVRGDLSLAFALAGIVAAVRFRTTVKDLQNAVFAFAAIGIGLAAGTGSFTLAALMSVVFSLLMYGMWKLNVGDVGPSLQLSHGGIFLSDALVPGEVQRPVVVGDESAVEPVEQQDVPELEEAIDKLANYVRADALRAKGKYNTLMLVYTSRPNQAAEIVEAALEEHADRWVKVDEINLESEEFSVLEYLLRLKKKVDVGTMIEKLGAGPGRILRAVELKPMKGLRKRLT